jgi:TatD DNase family protein
MNNIPFTNIHTHTAAEPNTISIKNNAKNFSFLPTTDFISIGIHPWYINEKSATEEMSFIQKNAQNKNVLAIGECGLDKLAAAELSAQEHIFKAQLEIAQQLQKPVIIHCVKAFDSLVRIKKEMNLSVPMIVHGFNNNEQIAKELIRNGFYLSFGKALLQDNSNATKAIQLASIDSIFLETDDTDISIIAIFEAASKLLNIKEPLLVQHIYSNFKKVFKHE